MSFTFSASFLLPELLSVLRAALSFGSIFGLLRSSAPRLSRYHHNVPANITQIAENVPCFQAKAYSIAETGRSTNRRPTQTIPRYCRLGITTSDHTDETSTPMNNRQEIDPEGAFA